MSTEPLSPEYEAEIRERAGSGLTAAEVGLDTYSARTTSLGCGDEQALYTIAAGLRRQSVQARKDLPALLAELDRLRAELAAREVVAVQYAVRTAGGSVFALDTDRKAAEAFLAEQGHHLPEPVLVSRPLTAAGPWTAVEEGDA
ncbi:hypothetical protein [Streptomyces syringium]|uniref:hypothetical protein n=1 Tax=Streptomyces syringium TaxID=76729 RepID=UPI003AAD92F7